MALRDKAGRNSIIIDGAKGNIDLDDERGNQSFSIESTPFPGSNLMINDCHDETSA
jgi:hypothetical protein